VLSYCEALLIALYSSDGCTGRFLQRQKLPLC